MERLPCRTFAADAVRLQLLHALAYNLGNFMRTLAMPKTAEPWSLTSLREKLIKIGAKEASHGHYVSFQMAEVTASRQIFADILALIARLRAADDISVMERPEFAYTESRARPAVLTVTAARRLARPAFTWAGRDRRC
jgi:hypothetical protein